MAVALAKRELASSSSRGEDTRQRLIEAALKIFGDCGFEGASTRMLADAAGANLAAIPYHFGSKEGLYRAAAEFIVENCGSEILPTIERDRTHARRKEARAQRCDHAAARAAGAVFRDRGRLGVRRRFAGFVMREQLQPGAAFEILYEGMMAD